MAKSDAELVADILSGDSQAFEELVRRHQRLVFNIIYHYLGQREVVEDLAQEVFLKVFRTLGTFDPSRPLAPWISRITANCCLDQLRRRKRRRVTLFSDLSRDEERQVEEVFDQSVHGEGLTVTEAEDSLKLLESLMGILNKKDRMVFTLRELEGQSYAEIAEAMGVSELAVRIRVSRARRKLQERLERIVYKGEDHRRGNQKGREAK